MKINSSTTLRLLPTHGNRNRPRRRPNPYGRLIRPRLYYALLVLAFGLFASSVVADCIAPIALWKLDEEGSSPIFHDAVNPGSNAGICRLEDSVSLCPEAEPGRDGNGQRFYTNGSHTGIDIPAGPLFNWNGKASFSIAYWMKRNNTPFDNNEVIVSKDSKEEGNDLHWWIGIHLRGTAMAVFNDKTEVPKRGTKYLKGYKLLTDNNWHYIVLVRNGATSESRLYVDGVLEDKKHFTHDTSDAFIASSTDVNIGWINLYHGYFYKGVIDEIALYDVALPQWFIRDRYHAEERYSADQPDHCE